MDRNSDRFAKAEELCRAVIARAGEAEPRPGFSGRVMAHIQERARARKDQAFFLRVAAHIALGGAVLAAVLAVAFVKAYTDLDMASLAQALAGTGSLPYLSL